MKYYIFIQDNIIRGVGQTNILNDDIRNVEITEEMYNKFVTDSDLVMWDEEKQELIDNPHYEELKAKQREEEFNQEFFPTSLGYVKRKVTMKDGYTQKDFLSDILPLISSNANLPILVYMKPDFTKDFTNEDMVKLQRVAVVTEQFIEECKARILMDFYGYVPTNVILTPTKEEPTLEPEPSTNDTIVEDETKDENEEPVVDESDEDNTNTDTEVDTDTTESTISTEETEDIEG